MYDLHNKFGDVVKQGKKNRLRCTGYMLYRQLDW